MQALPIGDRYTAVGHLGSLLWNPLPIEVALEALNRLKLQADQQVLDIGCGPAELLLRLVEQHQVRALGIDRSTFAIQSAQAQRLLRDPGGHLELRCESFDAGTLVPKSFDLVLCLGSGGAIGSPPEALATIAGLLRPGGHALMGELIRLPMDLPDDLAQLQPLLESVITPENYEHQAHQAGFSQVLRYQCTAARMDDYEQRHNHNIESYAQRHGNDDDAAAMLERSRAWRAAYLRLGRHVLRFAMYLLTLDPAR